jgi:uncharacterized delta-60 repeat protein
MYKNKNGNLIFKLLFLLFISISTFAQNPVRDTTFHHTGIVRTAIGPNNEDASSVVVQPDDKIIAAGTQTDNPTFGPQNFCLVRYQKNGDLDSTFGVNGIVISSFMSQNWLKVITLQPDGKILAAGQSSVNCCIARYNNDGSLDSTFGTNGVTMVTAISGSTVNDLKILSNGNIIVAGTNAIPGFNYEIRMLRLTSTGLVDSTFGNNGMVSDTLGFHSAIVSSVLIQSDNKIVLGGRVSYIDGGGTEVTQMYLARFLETGIIDSTYGINGMASYPLALNNNDMTFDANENIIAVGEIGTNSLGTSGDIVVMRITPAGVPDSTFGNNGSTVISVDSYADYVNAVLLQADGKILVGGSYFDFGAGTTTDCLIIRFLDNGSPDSTFGVNGIFKTGVTSGTDRILDMTMDSENKIVISGTANFSVNFDFVVGRIIMDLSTNDMNAVINHPELLLFPNPVSGTLNVHSGKGEISEVNIFNLSGQTIYSRKIHAVTDFQIDVSGFERGIYLLKLNSDSGMLVKKFEVLD